MEKAVLDLAEYYEKCTAGQNCAASNAFTHIKHPQVSESSFINADQFLQKMFDHRGYCENGLQKIIREKKTEAEVKKCLKLVFTSVKNL